MRRAFLVLVAALALTACQVDTSVDLEVEPDGSGTITVNATADADVVAQAPGLAEDLRFDDAVAAGWTLQGPTVTDAGGLSVTLTHDFATAEEATVLLASVNGSGGPLHDVVVTRTVTNDEITTSLAGTLRIDGGVDAFADPEMLAAIDGSPYADNIAATGLRPTDVVTFTFTAELPGELATTGTDLDAEAEPVLSWSVPLDATSVDVARVSVLPQGRPDSLWGTVADIALVALVVWCLLAVAFIAFVATARSRKAQHRANPRPADRPT